MNVNKKMDKKTYTLDIDYIRGLNKKIESNNKKFKEAFGNIKNIVKEEFGINIPEHLRRLSIDMYKEIRLDTPYVLDFVVKGIVESVGQEYEQIVIKNPKGIYNLCAGLGSSSVVNGSKFSLEEIIVEGDVGTYYGALSADRQFSHTIKGCAGRSFMDNCRKGKIIVEGIADDGAAQVNHGAYFLFEEKVGPRLACLQRSGGVVTLKNLPFNTGLYMTGGNILTLGDDIEDEIGPDMKEGRIYVPKLNSNILGKGAVGVQIQAEDYGRIFDVLKPFSKELDISADCLNENNPVMMINGMEYNFSKYYKIMPKNLLECRVRQQ